MMRKRPILVSIAYWIVVQLILGYRYLHCGIGAGWDEESNQRIVDCHAAADMWNQAILALAILVYVVWAVMTIRGLRRDAE